jgi:hypothetical protein
VIPRHGRGGCTPLATGTVRPCFTCGYGIASDDFLEWPDSPGSTFAICGHCGAPNELHDTAFVVLPRQTGALPTPRMDVFPLASGRWRACCDCGLTEAAVTEAVGWAWVLDHGCMAYTPPPTANLVDRQAAAKTR